MLRGQASLQELIGRSFMNRKRSGPKTKRKPPSVETASKAPEPAALETSNTVVAGQKSQVSVPGQALCPVCGVPVLERAMNGHLGMGCLCVSAACSQDVSLTASIMCRHLSGKGDTAAQQRGRKAINPAALCFASRQY